MLGDVGKAEKLIKESFGNDQKVLNWIKNGAVWWADDRKIIDCIKKIKSGNNGAERYNKLIDNLLGERGIIYYLSTRPHTSSNSNFIKLVKNKVFKQNALIEYLKGNNPNYNVKNVQDSLKRYARLTRDKSEDTVPESETDPDLKVQLKRKKHFTPYNKFKFSSKVNRLKGVALSILIVLIGSIEIPKERARIIASGKLTENLYGRYPGHCGLTEEERQSLTNLEFPKGIKWIGDGDFSECSNLKTVTIPSSVEFIGRGAFELCDGIETLTIQNGVKSILHHAFNLCSKLSTLTIPRSVKKIGANAFHSCNSLKSVTIEGDLETLGSFAFACCRNLKKLVLKGNINKIGRNAFVECPDDMEINVDALDDETGSKMIEVIGEQVGKYSADQVPPDGVVDLSGKAMSQTDFEALQLAGNNDLKEIYVPEGVTKIPRLFFSGCSNLTKVTLPKTVREIGFAAFGECKSLKEIIMHDAFDKIGKKAFYGCSSLKDVIVRRSKRYCRDELKLENSFGSGVKITYLER